MPDPASLATRIVCGAIGIAVFLGLAAMLWGISADPTIAALQPPLGKVIAAMSDPGLWSEVRITLSVLLFAFARALLYGLPLGAAIGLFPMFGLFAVPVLRMLLALPLVAAIPMMMLWYGLGAEQAAPLPALAMAIVIAAGVAGAFAPPAATPTGPVASPASVAQRIADAVQDAPPEIFATLRTALRIGALIVIANELVVGKSGIGAQLIQAVMTFDAPKAAAAVLDAWLALLALDLALAGAQMATTYVRTRRTASGTRPS